MNIIYICRVSDFQVEGNQIDISKKVAIDFFNVPESEIELKHNVGINICHASDPRTFEIIEIQPATNLRWSTKLNSYLAQNNDELTKGCLLLFEKLGRSFCVRTIKNGDAKYDALVDLFEEGEKHMLLSASLDNQETNKKDDVSSLQQIFYGAPGTGKSHTIKTEVDEKGKQNFRVTFHPDSDYSTFVGAYKPTMKENIITKNGVETKEEQIVYRFVPQAFTKAYTTAWNTEDDVYLIIEEINRGNCAQIFGDLFQLLDRKNGVSQYPIDADTDLADYIAKELANSPRTDFPEKVKEGKKLVLPSNLYIWATMNTSDQSLFPIDSAFKRRWDWKYLKIKDHPDQHYRIKLNDEVEYDWYAFIERINQIIASMTSSADKQLGYFFCKADDDGIIKADTFVAKVIFYLWNDVFKDYGFEDTSLFTFTEIVDGKEETRELTFPDFYDKEGEKVDETRLKGFIDSVMNWKKKKEESN